MVRKRESRIVVVHADESCLGNGTDGQSPGGASALIEVATPEGILRRDLYISAPDTTNNRMALCGAIAVFALLSQKGHTYRVVYVSDSQYLVKGATEWAPAWRARGWRRKGGPVENLKLWQTLLETSGPHLVEWRWVRGHAGHVKNEYTDYMAVRAPKEQIHSDGAIDSELADWLAQSRERGHYTDYDPDEAFGELATEMENQ